jgi:hypothetical protein
VDTPNACAACSGVSVCQAVDVGPGESAADPVFW